jgi:hypothetical protein
MIDVANYRLYCVVDDTPSFFRKHKIIDNESNSVQFCSNVKISREVRNMVVPVQRATM